MLAAQRLSILQSLVPGIQARLFQQISAGRGSPQMLAAQELSAQIFVPVTQEILFQQVVVLQVMAAQPLSQILVPGIQVRLFQHTSVVQVLAAQELSAQILVPGTQAKLFQQVCPVQVLAAQRLSVMQVVPERVPPEGQEYEAVAV